MPPPATCFVGKVGGGGEIVTLTLGSHEVLVRFTRKDREEVEDVKEEVLIGRGHLAEEALVGGDDLLVGVGLLCEGVTELVVEVVGYDRFWHLGEVSSEDAGDVVSGICFLFPVQVLAVLRVGELREGEGRGGGGGEEEGGGVHQEKRPGAQSGLRRTQAGSSVSNAQELQKLLPDIKRSQDT